MTEKKYLKQLNDSPLILNEKNDILWTKRIAEKIEIIVDYSFSDESFVIWLQWTWWAWKTSILETIKKYYDNKNVKILDFKPWIYNSNSDLYSKFIDELSNVLNLWKNSNFNAIDEKMKLYKFEKEITNDTLGFVKNFFSKVDSILPWFLNNNYVYIWLWLMIINSIISILVKFIHLEGFLNSITLVLSIITAVLSAIILVYGIKKNKKILDEINNYKPVLELKNDVQELLNSEKLLVIIDDLDRLHPEQVITIFQLVKSIANFKNTIFLLSYDKGVVAPILSKKYDNTWYLKKIIQLEINIPILTRENLYDFLYEELNETINEINAVFWTRYYLSASEINKIKQFFIDGVWKNVFRNIRDVKRYINFFKSEILLIHDFLSQNEIYLYDFIMFRIIEFYDYDLLFKIYEYYSPIVLLHRLPQGYDIEQRQIFEKYLDWIWVINNLLPIQSNLDYLNPYSAIQPDKFLNYFSLKIEWVSETDFHLFSYMVNAWSSLSENFLKELLGRTTWTSLKKVIINNIKRLDIKHEKWLHEMIGVIKYLLSSEDVFEQYNRNYTIPWHFHLHDIFRDFMQQLSSDKEIYIKSYIDILNTLDFNDSIYQLISYASIFFIDSNEDVIVDLKQMVWEENIKHLYEKTKKVFLKKVHENQLHKNYNYWFIIECARKLWWISSIRLYNYLEDNNLIDKFQYEYPFNISINHRKKDIKNYISRMVEIFEEKELRKIIWFFKDEKYYESLLLELNDFYAWKNVKINR